MAKIVIVNEKDEPIGYRERGSRAQSEGICRISVLWLTNSKGEVLLAKRKMNKKYNPGKWGPAVGGTVEEGETYDSNIYKEASEEIGLSGFVFEKGEKIFVETPNKRFCQIYCLTIDREFDQFQIQEEEVDQVKWFGQDELKNEIEHNPDIFTELVPKLFFKE